MITKERKEYYINLIKNSFSLREVCLKAGIVATTGNYDTLKRIIKDGNIDITHFKRQTGGARNSHEIEFYLQKGSAISSYKLKNKLLKEGIKEYKCESCGNTEWLGKPIKLELHHINGDNTDNRIENLQFLCPNCHAYTDNFGGKNQKVNIKDFVPKKERKYIDIDYLQELLNKYEDIVIVSEKMGKTVRTIKKYIKTYNLTMPPKKISYNETEMIQLMKEERNYTKVGEKLGITDNAVRKRFKRLGYPVNIKDLLEII